MPFSIVGGKFFFSSYTLHAGAFCSVWNCTSSFLLLSIFHFLFTNFGRQPFPEKVIQASLIRIINRLHDANEPLAKDIFGCVQISPSKKVWLPWILWNAHFSCCSIMPSAHLLEQYIDQDKTQSWYAKKERGVRFSMMEIFTNCVGIVRLILVT